MGRAQSCGVAVRGLAPDAVADGDSRDGSGGGGLVVVRGPSWGCTARAPRRRRWPWAVAGLAVVGLSLWSLGPRLALDGGTNGLDFYDRYLADALNLLKSGGSVFFEMGDTQGEALEHLMQGYGFSDIKILKDLSGRDRYAVAMLP